MSQYVSESFSLEIIFEVYLVRIFPKAFTLLGEQHLARASLRASSKQLVKHLLQIQQQAQQKAKGLSIKSLVWQIRRFCLLRVKPPKTRYPSSLFSIKTKSL